MGKFSLKTNGVQTGRQNSLQQPFFVIKRYDRTSKSNQNSDFVKLTNPNVYTSKDACTIELFFFLSARVV